MCGYLQRFKIFGIDFSALFCDEAIKNLLFIQNKTAPFLQNIMHNNVLNYTIPAYVDCLFLFNPFNEKLMQQLVNKINKSLQQSPRCSILFI